MLVSHRCRFIYTKTVKTGGTSVESYFEKYCMPEGEWARTHERDCHDSEAGVIGYRGSARPKDCKWWNHMPAELIRSQLDAQTWREYVKFCVVRNPFDKVVSAFYYFDRNRPKSFFKPSAAQERTRFSAWLSDESRLPVDRDKYIIDGAFCLDRVLRYEQLKKDMEKLCIDLSIPWNEAELPKFKQGFRPRQATADSLFTPATRALVEKTYGLELELFGYRFPG